MAKKQPPPEPEQPEPEVEAPEAEAPDAPTAWELQFGEPEPES